MEVYLLAHHVEHELRSTLLSPVQPRPGALLSGLNLTTNNVLLELANNFQKGRASLHQNYELLVSA